MSDTITSTGGATTPPDPGIGPARPASPRRILAALLRRLPKELRYLAVGATCAILYNVLLIGVVTLGLGYLPGTVIALVPVLFVGYGLHAAVTFETRFSRPAFVRYCLTILASYPVWLGILFVLSDVAALPIVVAAPLGTALMFLLNYVTAHWAIMRSVRAAFRRRAFGGSPEEP